VRTTGPVKTDASSFDELRPVAKKLVKLREQAPLYKRSEGVLEDLVKLRAQAILRTMYERDYMRKDTSHLEETLRAGDTSLVSGRRHTTLPARAW